MGNDIELNIPRLRRLIDESDDTVYDDDTIEKYFEESREDIYLTAGKIWEEKASALAKRFDMDADGSNLTRSQLYEHAIRQAAVMRSRSKVRDVPFQEEDNYDDLPNL